MCMVNEQFGTRDITTENDILITIILYEDPKMRY